MSASLLPNAKAQFIDINGAPLVDGTVTFYVPSSTTPKDTWQDADQNILNTNPVDLDERGQALIWGSGYYRQVVRDKDGNLIWDQVTLAPNSTDDTSIESLLIFETIADAQAATIPDGVSVIQVNRYASDRPIFPISYELTTSNCYCFKSNANAKKWRIAQDLAVSPWAFGAYGDGASHLIDSQDILDNPQWIGIYVAGVEWDTVARNESLYHAFANAGSSPGVVVWNLSASNASNRPWYQLGGQLRINRTISIAMSGFTIGMAARLSSKWLDYVPDAPCFTCDSAVFGVFDDISIDVQTLKNQGLEVWSLDGSGVYGGLKTQQVTINNPVLTGNLLADIGLSISRAGGAAQGDTIAINNPFINTFVIAGIDSGPTFAAQNALSNKINGGNIQFCPTGVRINGGSAFPSGTSFQPGNGIANLGFHSAPYVNQITANAADVRIDSGAGFTVIPAIENIRSEGSVPVLGPGGPFVASNVSAAGADIEVAYTDLYYVPGTTIKPQVNNTKNRVFLTVETGGEDIWRDIPNTGTVSVLGPFSAAWTVNQWVGYKVAFRFTNGFVSYIPIASNTADTLTIATPTFCAPTQMAMIVGNTGPTQPAWDSAPDGTAVWIQGGNSFTTTQGSDIVSISNTTLANGQWIAISAGMRFGTSGGMQFPCMFLAEVIDAAYGVGQIQIDRPAALTLSEAPGFYGATTFKFGDYSVMEIPFNAFTGASYANTITLPNGWLRSCYMYENVFVGYTDDTRASSAIVKSWSPLKSINPTVTAATPPTGVTYTTNSGHYRVIQGQCFYTFNIVINSVGAGGSGDLTISTPLPAYGNLSTDPLERGGISLGTVTYAGSAALRMRSLHVAGAFVQLSASGVAITNLQWSGLTTGSVLAGTIAFPVSPMQS